MLWKKLLQICSMVAIIAALSACSDFPLIHPRLTSLKNKVCTDINVVSHKPLQVAMGERHPVSECDGYVGIPAKEASELVAWCNNHPDDCPL